MWYMLSPLGAWTVGGLIGPGIGGLLTEPAIHHPNIFSEHGIFGRCCCRRLIGLHVVTKLNHLRHYRQSSGSAQEHYMLLCRIPSWIIARVHRLYRQQLELLFVTSALIVGCFQRFSRLKYRKG